MKSPFRPLAASLLATFALLVQIMPLAARAELPAAPAMTAEDVHAWVDGVMRVEMKRDDIAGAVVCIVKDGTVLFESGYGFADEGRRIPVSPQDTLFRVGSVSKLFTGTAVMQLVEAGRLDLDQDINAYIDFRIPATYPQPITLRTLLTHTAGFEEVARDLFSSSPTPLDRYLKTHLPTRIYAPGVVGAYSNYGVALAGYIVQRVSGEPFDDYVADHIFKPLRMRHATFTQPVPASLVADLSKGYQTASGKAQPFEYISAAPAGGLSIAADDMARFMMAHLQNGQLEGVRILGTQTAQQMHARQYGADPLLNGMAINFFQESRNGHLIIGHGGDTIYFHSQLHLILDANVGFFMAANSSGLGGFDYRGALWDAFLDRYFPYQAPEPVVLSAAASDAQDLAGSYIFTRRNDDGFLKLGYLLAAAGVAANPDGTLIFPDTRPFIRQPPLWQEIGSRVYQRVGAQQRIAFKASAAGQSFLVTDSAQNFQRDAWYQSRGFVIWNLAVMLGVLLATLVWWPLGAILRRHYGRPLALTAGELRLRLLVRLICLWDAGVMLGWCMVYAAIGGALSFPSVRALWVLELASLIGALATASICCQVYWSWLAPGRGTWVRLGDSAIMLACLVFSWIVYLGNLATFNLNF